MAINRSSYVQFWVQRRYGAVPNTDVVIDNDGNILAWNTNKGTQPTVAEIDTAVLAAYRQDMIASVNTLAGNVRQSYLADGLHIAEEYRIAEEEAKQYKADNYTGTVPPTVADYAAILGAPPKIVADTILQKASEFRLLFVTLRKLRLQATQKLSVATTESQIAVEFNAAVVALEALRRV